MQELKLMENYPVWELLCFKATQGSGRQQVILLRAAALHRFVLARSGRGNGAHKAQ